MHTGNFVTLAQMIPGSYCKYVEFNYCLYMLLTSGHTFLSEIVIFIVLLHCSLFTTKSHPVYLYSVYEDHWCLHVATPVTKPDKRRSSCWDWLFPSCWFWVNDSSNLSWILQSLFAVATWFHTSMSVGIGPGCCGCGFDPKLCSKCISGVVT